VIDFCFFIALLLACGCANLVRRRQEGSEAAGESAGPAQQLRPPSAAAAAAGLVWSNLDDLQLTRLLQKESRLD
jgi:hypothetical protein